MMAPSTYQIENCYIKVALPDKRPNIASEPNASIPRKKINVNFDCGDNRVDTFDIFV